MVTKRVELPATAASARREREGKPQAAQQEHTEQGTGQGDVIPRGRDVKSAGGERPSLGQQQRSRSKCKVRKVHLVRALVTSMGSESLPALERPTFAGYCVVGTGCDTTNCFAAQCFLEDWRLAGLGHEGSTRAFVRSNTLLYGLEMAACTVVAAAEPSTTAVVGFFVAPVCRRYTTKTVFPPDVIGDSGLWGKRLLLKQLVLSHACFQQVAHSLLSRSCHGP